MLFRSQQLDEAGHIQVGIISYAVKYASALYGPFREAAGSDQFAGDRKHHQLGFSQKREGVAKALQDIKEGADAVIVKPGGWYGDMISRVRKKIDQPLLAYQVSGEYAMIKSASENGALNEAEAVYESLMSLRRAGADLIITYFAKKISFT